MSTHLNRSSSASGIEKIRMSNFVIYLSNDPKREILKITGAPKIGRIIARMRKFDEIVQ